MKAKIKYIEKHEKEINPVVDGVVIYLGYQGYATFTHKGITYKAYPDKENIQPGQAAAIKIKNGELIFTSKMVVEKMFDAGT